jgi:hypothetical protein
VELAHELAFAPAMTARNSALTLLLRKTAMQGIARYNPYPLPHNRRSSLGPNSNNLHHLHTIHLNNRLHLNHHLHNNNLVNLNHAMANGRNGGSA